MLRDAFRTKFTAILSLIFAIMFSLPSYAKWTQVTKNSTATFYVDFERIQKVDGYVYFWDLTDL